MSNQKTLSLKEPTKIRFDRLRGEMSQDGFLFELMELHESMTPTMRAWQLASPAEKQATLDAIMAETRKGES